MIDLLSCKMIYFMFELSLSVDFFATFILKSPSIIFLLSCTISSSQYSSYIKKIGDWHLKNDTVQYIFRSKVHSWFQLTINSHDFVSVGFRWVWLYIFLKGLTGVLFKKKLKCKMKNKDKLSHLTHSQSLFTITVTTHTHSQSPLILAITTRNLNHLNREPPTHTWAHTTHLNSSNIHTYTHTHIHTYTHTHTFTQFTGMLEKRTKFLLKKTRRALFYSNHHTDQTLIKKIKYKVKVGSYSCKYLISVLEEKTRRIGHGLEINGGKNVKQQSEWRKENKKNI
jgi:hypothetical protein